LSADFNWQSAVRPDRSILFGHEDAKRALLHAKVHRAIADQFAVEFDWDGLIAFHAQPPGLEIFNLRHANVGTKYYVLQVFDDLEIPEPLEDDDVLKAIVDHGVFKKWKSAAIEAYVADQDE